MNRIEPVSNTGPCDPADRIFYKAGAVAALIAAVLFRRNLDAEWMLLRGAGIITAGPDAAPITVFDWFMLLQNNTLLGLTLLNLFDLVNYALVGVIFLAFFAALRRASPSWMFIAAALGFAGITVYFTSNQAFTMLSLSRQHATATNDVQRANLLAAGQAVLAIHQNNSYAGTGIYLSFLLVSVAGLIISAIMLHSCIFSKGTAYLGILANGFGLGYYIAFAFVPALVYVPLSVSAIFLLIWYLWISKRLWTLGTCAFIGPVNVASFSDRDASQRKHDVPQSV